MIDANELRKGTTFFMDGELYQVLEYQHYKPGRGNAIIRTKIRNMRTGASIPQNFLSNARVEEAPVERRPAQFLYNDGEQCHFMDTDSYDERTIKTEYISSQVGFLRDGMEISITVFESEVLDIELPMTVELEIVDAEIAIAGDTATGASKMVTCDSGLKVQVPLFVNVGDVIRVDTRSGAYVTRV